MLKLPPCFGEAGEIHHDSVARFHHAATPLSAAGAARQATTPFPGPRGARLQRGAAGALRCDGRAEGSFDENVVRDSFI